MKNTSGKVIEGFTHAFQIYAEDPDQPVDWGDASGVVADELASLYPADFIIPTIKTGSDIDTAGFNAAGLSVELSGVPVDAIVPAFEITIGPIDESMAGRKVCIDQILELETSPGVFYPWMWSHDGGAESNFDVTWSGERCFEIE